MPATDAERIAAEGVPIVLRDGRTVRLRFSMRSLFEFERRWGSIEVATSALNDLIPPVVGVDDDGTPRIGRAPNRKPVSTVVPVLAIGLSHEGITEDDLLDGPLLDFRELAHDYLDAIIAALNEAFPPPEAPGKDESGEAAAASTGPASTTPPPSDLVAATPSSGA